MRFPRTLAAAGALTLAAGLNAQTPGPTTGGSTPPPSSPTTGGTAPTPPTVIFPTNMGTPTTGGTATAGTSTTSAAAIIAGSTFPTSLVNVPGVPAALSLNDRQQAQLNTLTQQVQAQFLPQYNRLSSLPADQQAAQRTLLDQQYAAAWLNAARSVFTADQLARFQQLQFQFGGFASLTSPVAQGALNLTAAQQNQLRQDIAWAAQQQAAIQQAAQTNQARALQLFNEFNTASQTRLNQLLTPTQQQQFAQLSGTPFTFPPVFPAATGATGTPGTIGTIGPAGTAATTGTAGSTSLPPTITVPGRTGPVGTSLTPTVPGPTTGGFAAPTNTVPGRTGPRGATLTPGTPGPTTGGFAPPPTGPTTGGPAPTPGPTTGGPAPGGPGAVPPKM